MDLKLVILLLVAAPFMCLASKKETVQLSEHLLNTSIKTTAPSPTRTVNTSDAEMVSCGAYQAGKDTCENCEFADIDNIDEVNQYSLHSGNPIASFLNQSIDEEALIFAVMTYNGELHMQWNYSEHLPYASQISITAYGSLKRNKTFVPIKSCCGVRLDTGVRICPLEENYGDSEEIFKTYFVRISLLRSTFTTMLYARGASTGLSRFLTGSSGDGPLSDIGGADFGVYSYKIQVDTTDKLVRVKQSVDSLKYSFDPTDKYRYTCLFNMDKNDVEAKHTRQDLQMSQIFDREVYEMPHHQYIKDGLYDSNKQEIECDMTYIDRNISSELEFENADPNKFTCLSLVLQMQQNSSYREVLCLPPKKTDYLRRLYHENSNEKSMMITVATLVMVVVLLITIVAMVTIRRYLKQTRHSDMEIPETLAEVCKQDKTAIGDFIHWQLPLTIEEDPTAIDISDAQIYHQVDLQSDEQPSRSVSISYVTVKFQSDCDSSSSTSRDSHDHDGDDTSSREQVTSSTKRADDDEDERESGFGESTSSRDSPRSSNGGGGYSPKEELEYKPPSSQPQEGAAAGEDNAVFEGDEEATTAGSHIVAVSPYMNKSFVM